MPRRHSEVIKFLGDAFAADAVGVPKFDAMAHAAGLLGEGQRITNAKVFRRAKDALGIRTLFAFVFASAPFAPPLSLRDMAARNACSL